MSVYGTITSLKSVAVSSLFFLSSLARACYADADVYLFDDPLSAVDTHVASHLLKHVLGRGGLLAGRTRIIATHHPSAIAASDRVAVLDSGRLIEYGSYASLSRRSTSHLNAFLRSEELRQRLISESEAASESRPPPSAAMGPEISVVSSHRRRRTSTESHPSSYIPPGDFAKCKFWDIGLIYRRTGGERGALTVRLIDSQKNFFLVKKRHDTQHSVPRPSSFPMSVVGVGCRVKELQIFLISCFLINCEFRLFINQNGHLLVF